MIFSTLKRWTVSLAERYTAQHWLGFIAFIESSVFPIPADVLYIPMSLVRPQKAYHYAFIATTCSVLGGIAGWFIGYFAYDNIAKPILEFYNKYESFQTLKDDTTLEFLVILLMSSGFFHLPPIKIVTILSGAMGVHLWLFVIACILSRGARFYLLAWLIQRFGHQAIDFLSRHFKWVILVGCIMLLLFYGLYTVFLK
ncbi:YqaA family protein [Bartonella sp. A05]|uniref:YqaA family protein n=1 Tax=Bartonella sp. A05 TaxID=2967261 RepID=UPI0022A93D14|nr:YqaA family protein [Bartonella sp. A05]MCZ2203683.1 DedA family protein [Bartonella sp. A05]